MNTVGRWKIIAAALGLICIVLLYRLFDQGITRTYLDASQETSTRHVELLTNLVEYQWRGLDEEQVMLRLKAYVDSKPANSIVLKREPETNAVYLEGIRFEFHDGKLIKVK